MMANQKQFCEIHKIEKKKLPIQYWCPKCNKAYRDYYRKKYRVGINASQKDVTSEADPAKRDEKQIIFD